MKNSNLSIFHKRSPHEDYNFSPKRSYTSRYHPENGLETDRGYYQSNRNTETGKKFPSQRSVGKSQFETQRFTEISENMEKRYFNEVSKNKELLAEIKQKDDRLKHEIRSRKAEQATYLQEIKMLEDEIQLLKKNPNDNSRMNPSSFDFRNDRNMINPLIERLQTASTDHSVLDQAKARIRSINNEKMDLIDQLNNSKKEASQLQSKLKAAENFYEEKIGRYEKLLKEARLTIESLNENIDELTLDQAALKDLRATSDRQIYQIGNLTQEIARLKEESPERVVEIEQPELVEALEKKDEQIDDLQKKIEELQNAPPIVEEKGIIHIRQDPAILEEMDRRQDEIEKLRLTVNDRQDEIDSLRQTINDLKTAQIALRENSIRPSEQPGIEKESQLQNSRSRYSSPRHDGLKKVTRVSVRYESGDKSKSYRLSSNGPLQHARTSQNSNNNQNSSHPTSQQQTFLQLNRQSPNNESADSVRVHVIPEVHDKNYLSEQLYSPGPVVQEQTLKKTPPTQVQAPQFSFSNDKAYISEARMTTSLSTNQNSENPNFIKNPSQPQRSSNNRSSSHSHTNRQSPQNYQNGFYDEKRESVQEYYY